MLFFPCDPSRASWGYGPPVVDDIDVTGVYCCRIPLGNPASGLGDNLSLALCHRLIEVHGRVHSEIYVTGLQTSLAPKADSVFEWVSPNGVHERSRDNGAAAGMPLLGHVVACDCHTGAVLTEDGWTLLYANGELRRMISPHGRLYRCSTNGPFIENISVVAHGNSRALVVATYDRQNRILRLWTNSTDFRFERGLDGSVVRVFRNGTAWLGFGYSPKGLLSSITGDPRYAGQLQWARIGDLNFLAQAINPFGVMLQSYGSKTYHLTFSQSSVYITVRHPFKTMKAVYNLYTHTLSNYDD
jgi:hypothetical protein